MIKMELNQTEADQLFDLLYFRNYPVQAEKIIALEDVRGRLEQAMQEAGI